MAKLISLTTPPDNLKVVWDGYRLSRTILLVFHSGNMTTGNYDEYLDDDGNVEESHWRTDCSDGFDITENLIGWVELPTIEI